MSTDAVMIDRVYEALGDGPLDTNEIAEKVGAFPWDVQTMCRRLRARGRIILIGKRLKKPSPNIWEQAARRTLCTYLVKDEEGAEFTIQITFTDGQPLTPGIDALLMQLDATHATKDEITIGVRKFKVSGYRRELLQ